MTDGIYIIVGYTKYMGIVLIICNFVLIYRIQSVLGQLYIGDRLNLSLKQRLNRLSSANRNVVLIYTWGVRKDLFRKTPSTI